MLEVLINPTGDDFERILNNQIKNYKRNVIADKIYDYYLTQQFTTVDIPEFCKNPYDTIQSKVTRELDAICQAGKLDYYYNLTIT